MEELEHIKECIKNADHEFNQRINILATSVPLSNSLSNKITKNNIKIKNEKSNKAVKKNDADILEIKKSNKDPKKIPAWAKSAYKKIIVKTHPDKNITNDEDIVKKRESIYRRTVEYYKKHNFLHMTPFCLDLAINIAYPDSLSNEIEDLCKEMQKEIDKMKISFSWVWSKSSEKIKEEILYNVTNQNGIKAKRKDVKDAMNSKIPERRQGAKPRKIKGKPINRLRNRKN